MCKRTVVILLIGWICVAIIMGFLTPYAQANGRIIFTGNIFHITQPGQSLDKDFSEDTVPSGHWMLSGSWLMEIDPDVLEITRWEHNMVMLRSADRDNPLPKDARSNPTRGSHTVQFVLRDGKIRSLNFMTGLGRFTGIMDTMKNGKRQFWGDDIEILLTGGRGFKGMTNIEIRFVTEEDKVTNFSTSEDTKSTAKNAREHFGKVILGTVRKISVAE